MRGFIYGVSITVTAAVILAASGLVLALDKDVSNIRIKYSTELSHINGKLKSIDDTLKEIKGSIK